jgi:hypothetical protein
MMDVKGVDRRVKRVQDEGGKRAKDTSCSCVNWWRRLGRVKKVVDAVRDEKLSKTTIPRLSYMLLEVKHVPPPERTT